MAIDTIYEVHNDRDTSYRVIPNPDAPPGEGFKSGAVLQWKDKGDELWKDYFFIASGAFEDLSKIFAMAAEDVE